MREIDLTHLLDAIVVIDGHRYRCFEQSHERWRGKPVSKLTLTLEEAPKQATQPVNANSGDVV